MPKKLSAPTQARQQKDTGSFVWEYVFIDFDTVEVDTEGNILKIQYVGDVERRIIPEEHWSLFLKTYPSNTCRTKEEMPREPYLPDHTFDCNTGKGKISLRDWSEYSDILVKTTDEIFFLFHRTRVVYDILQTFEGRVCTLHIIGIRSL
jgi:hypothetical protein